MENATLLTILHRFETDRLTLAQSAKAAGLSLEAFLEVVQEHGRVAVDYPPEELIEEIRWLAGE